MYSRSCVFAVPDGAYILISSVPLYSAEIARLDGNLVTFVRVMPSFANIAVPRMEDQMLWCVSYPPTFVVSGLVTSCAKRMSMSSCTRKNFSSISTLILDVMPLILSVAILIVSIFPLRGGVGVMCYSAFIYGLSNLCIGAWSCCVYFRAADLRSHQRAFF